MVHFRQAAVEQPPARYARRPPGSPPRLGGPLTFRLVRAFQTRLCTAPYILAAAPAAAPSRTPHPAPRNLEADSGGAYRSEANSRIPQLTHTIKLIIASVKSVTQGCDGSFSTGSGRTTPCSLRSPPPRLAPVYNPHIYSLPHQRQHLHESRITNHEISEMCLSGLAAVRLTHEYRS